MLTRGWFEVPIFPITRSPKLTSSQINGQVELTRILGSFNSSSHVLIQGISCTGFVWNISKASLLTVWGPQFFGTYHTKTNQRSSPSIIQVITPTMSVLVLRPVRTVMTSLWRWLMTAGYVMITPSLNNVTGCVSVKSVQLWTLMTTATGYFLYLRLKSRFVASRRLIPSVIVR